MSPDPEPLTLISQQINRNWQMFHRKNENSKSCSPPQEQTVRMKQRIIDPSAYY